MPCRDLPAGFALHQRVDLTDKKTNILVNIVALFVCLVMVLLGFTLHPLGIVVDKSRPLLSLLPLGALVALALLHLLVHDRLHGLAIRLLCGQRPNYGFCGQYLYAGKPDVCFTKAQYLFIALLPLTAIGLPLAGLLFVAGANWFWVVYLLEMIAFVSSLSDLYLAFLLLRMPRDVLIQDDGLHICFYLPPQGTISDK